MGDKKPTMTVDEAFEGIKILVFKDAYTKEGIEITRERMMTLLESEDLMNQIEEMMQEKNKQIKTIMKINLPYFLLADLANPLPEEIKMGFFTDNTIMGCSFDPDYDGYSVRSDNVLQQNFRWMLQDMDRDEFKIEQLPHFRYPKHIKDPNKLRSESNRRLSKKELAEFKKKTARL